MAYYNGSVTSLAALRSALVDACVANGWNWNSDAEVLSKGSLFNRVHITETDMRFLGRTSADEGDAPGEVVIGRLCSSSGWPTYDFTWPAEYHLFVFTDPDEVYLVVRYDLDFYQWAAFGQSAVAGLPGSGMWIGATRGSQQAVLDAGSGGVAILGRSVGGHSGVFGRFYLSPAMFWTTQSATPVARRQDRNCFVHSNLDGQGWLLNQLISDACIGVTAISDLLITQPSAWNSEAALIPLRAWMIRPSSRVSLVADAHNARHVRIDNYEPGQIIMIGPDRWMVFPWMRKDASARDGSSSPSDTQSIDHSGTFGWAIRYEGP